MIEQDQTYIKTKVKDWGSGKTKNTATIEVWPAQDQQMPSLPFLHAGDQFEDEKGDQWKITVARQCQEHHRYADEDGGFSLTYSWYYEAVDAASQD